MSEFEKRSLKLRLTQPHCEDCQISDIALTDKRQIHLRMRSDQGTHAIRLVPAPDSTLNFNGEPISSPAEIKALFEECGELRIDCQDTDYLPPYHVLELWGQGDRGFMCAIRAVECDYELIAPPAA